ncbi:MAG: hypothetical protein IPM71_14270 [Bacteroidota bacterium]|nr:MAG: hypothetical protein IPM71_14270 [Bacteroidota bacterium]
MSFSYYLPLVKKVKEFKSQKRKVEQALFPCYVFVLIKPGFRHHITEIKGVLCFVRFNDTYARIRDQEINSLKILVENTGESKKLTVEDLKKNGNMCRIEHGPLKGFEGKIVGNNGNKKLKIEIPSLNKMIVLQADDIVIQSTSCCEQAN